MSPSIARKIANSLRGQNKNQENKAKNLLTKRQNEIVEHLSKGLSYKLIAEKLEISLDTVRSHIRKIYSTLKVNSKLEVLNMYYDGKI